MSNESFGDLSDITTVLIQRGFIQVDRRLPLHRGAQGSWDILQPAEATDTSPSSTGPRIYEPTAMSACTASRTARSHSCSRPRPSGRDRPDGDLPVLATRLYRGRLGRGGMLAV